MSGASSVDAVPAFGHPDEYRRARDVLVEAGYTSEGVGDAIGSSDVTLTRPADMAPVLYRLQSESPLETLIRLFFLSLPVSRKTAEQALKPLSLEHWQSAALLRINGDTVEPLVRLRPYRELYVASDRAIDIRRGTRSDFVMGVAKSSMLVEHAGIRSDMGRTLDLGTGCGVLAMLARPHSQEVFATDKNPRAVAFADFNIKFNQLDKVATCVGDLLEPVADQQFDTILCNPPYVISPTARYLFCHSGQAGDEFCRTIIRQVPARLKEGGFCSLVCNWPHSEGQAWIDVARPWFEGLGCDVLVFGVFTQSAEDYITTWMKDTESDDEADWLRRYTAWMEYFGDREIAAITYGVVIMRRAGGRPNWVELEKTENGFQSPCGTEVLNRFRAWDYVYKHDDPTDMLEDRFRVADEFRLHQTLRKTSDGMSADSMTIDVLNGLSPKIGVDATIVQLLIMCDGQRTLRQVLEEMARTNEVGREQFTRDGLQIVRELVGRGFLRPANP